MKLETKGSKYIFKLENQMTWKTWILRKAEGPIQYHGRSLNCQQIYSTWFLYTDTHSQIWNELIKNNKN